MSRPLTILALTPSVGGHFFGDLLAGVAREVAAVEGRLLVVETLQEYAPRDEAGEQGDFATHVAWAGVDGVVSLTTAVGEDYLLRLREDGKPVVLISSTQMNNLYAPEVRPGNHVGTVAAVEHLVGHGHTSIGFVGNLAQRDILERYDAYKAVLESHGLTADPSHLFLTPANSEAGGVVAARSFLSSPQRPTALMIATDRNALGLVGAVKAAGLTLPRDLAVMSFDNIPAGTFSTPTLSSVDPRFDHIGALAGRTVLAAIRGSATQTGTFTPDTATLVLRESCGCDAEALRGRVPNIRASSGASSAALRDTLVDVLDRELRTGNAAADGPSRAAVSAVVLEAEQLLEAGDAATAGQIRAFAASLRHLACRPDTLRRFTEVMTAYVHPASADAGAASVDASPVPARIAAALWKTQASAFLHQTEAVDAATVEQYVVDAGLLDTGGADPRELGWLAGTRVKAGVLALWEGSPASGRLKVVGEHVLTGEPLGLLNAVVECEGFPQEQLLARASSADRDVCMVVPVRTRDQDWGLLAVVSDIDPTTTRERYQHWAALLCAALESQRRQEEVRRSALFDALTGLPNRRLFVQQLEQAMARAKRSGTPYSVLFLDLDGFKLINDSLGHQMGDRVLQAAGAAIARELREVDMAARFGGDEFVILLADTEPGAAMAAAQRVQAALARVGSFDGHEFEMRASIGIASSAVGYTAAEEVLQDADAAMYSAKAMEPGSVAYFDAPMHETAQRRATLAKEVLSGLRENQFEVLYQPIVSLDTGRTDRFEALVRWHHPSLGFIEPDQFLADIEETSLIVQLGHWVIDEVCRQLAVWGPRVANVSINISDKEFWSQDLLSHVLGSLERHGLGPEVLTLEITEGVLMRRPEMALRMAHKLHEAGLRLHIDDFGTGYSSLETLNRFPVDAFKIDRYFIQTLASAENSAELIGSLVKLGNALGLAVLAEGVETEEQREFLQGLGCATGQGFLFMPAVNGDRVEDLVGRSLHERGGD